MIAVTNDILSITLYRTLTINIPFPLYRPLLGIYYPFQLSILQVFVIIALTR